MHPLVICNSLVDQYLQLHPLILYGWSCLGSKLFAACFEVYRLLCLIYAILPRGALFLEDLDGLARELRVGFLLLCFIAHFSLFFRAKAKQLFELVANISLFMVIVTIFKVAKVAN